MKAIKVISIITAVMVLFVAVVGIESASAMNNESAAMLAGAIAVFGRPVLHAVAGTLFYPPAYYYSPPARTYYAPVSTRVIRVYKSPPCSYYYPCEKRIYYNYRHNYYYDYR